MEVLSGRALLPSEDVHHLDGDRFNNHPANLVIVAHAQHISSTNRRYPLVGYCAVCAKAFQQGRRGNRTLTCGRACGGRLGWRTRRAGSARPPAAKDGRNPPEVRRRLMRWRRNHARR